MPEVFKANKEEKKVSKNHQRSEGVFKSLVHMRSSNPFASFAVAPNDMRFEGQEEEEKIILLLRQHPIVMIPWMLLTALFLILPSFWEFLPWAGLMPARFETFTIILWYLLVAAFVFEKFLDWYFNVYIVTDERVVDVDFYGLLHKDMTMVRLDSIEEINYTQTGGVAAIFDYGDVFVQTAAEKRQLDFLRVPRPNKVVEILYQLEQEEEQERLEGRVK